MPVIPGSWVIGAVGTARYRAALVATPGIPGDRPKASGRRDSAGNCAHPWLTNHFHHLAPEEDRVDIDVYTGGGFGNTSANLALGVPNNGSAVVNVPNMQSATARVRVRCADKIFFAMSPGDFTINGPDLIFADGFD